MSQVAIIHKESRDNYISGNSYTWCPCCGKCYILSEEEVVNAIDNDLSDMPNVLVVIHFT